MNLQAQEKGKVTAWKALLSGMSSKNRFQSYACFHSAQESLRCPTGENIGELEGVTLFTQRNTLKSCIIQLHVTLEWFSINVNSLKKPGRFKRAYHFMKANRIDVLLAWTLDCLTNEHEELKK